MMLGSFPLALSEAVAARAKEQHDAQALWLTTQVRSEHAAGLDPAVRAIEERRYERDRALMVEAERVRDEMHTQFIARTFAHRSAA